MKLDLTGKTALVCGASQGIGAAAARELAQLGARVVLLARSPEPLALTLKSLAGPERGHKTIPVDLADGAAVEKAAETLVRELGPIEILVANAGGPPGGPIVDAEKDQFLAALGPHLFAPQALVKKLVPGMRERRYGRIVAVISTSVKAPIPGLGVSNTVRAAVANWAKTLSLELASSGITVNCVLPGYTRTGRLSGLIEATAKRTGKTTEAVEAEWREHVPAKRFAEPEEVASVVAFLATPAAGYVNGVAVQVDGGRTPSY
jgi:3-oxoacyl-[acyl-carrier protein] reductase